MLPTAPAPDPLAAAAPVLDVRGLTKAYGPRRAVDGLDLVLRPGRVTGFLGPNGAGKTTTIRMLLGLVRPTAGSGTVLGEPLERPAAYLGRVGAMIEGPAFLPALSARDNLLVLARLEGTEGRIASVLAQVGLGGREDDRVGDFSLGMHQRLGIAAALLPDPELLVLDEPTNGLDPAGIREVRALLRGLADAGRTVLVSSHLLAEIEAICDDVVVLREGRCEFAGPLGELLAGAGGRVLVRPEHPEDAGRLRAVLAEHGAVSVRDDGTLVVAAGAEAAAVLNRRAGAAGITLAELRTERGDLESRFLALTGPEA